MPIPERLIQRIRSATFSGPSVSECFENLARALSINQHRGGSVVLHYAGPDDLFSQDDLIPTIHLVLEPYHEETQADRLDDPYPEE